MLDAVPPPLTARERKDLQEPEKTRKNSKVTPMYEDQQLLLNTSPVSPTQDERREYTPQESTV